MDYDPDFQDPPAKRSGGGREKGGEPPPVALWTVVFVVNLPFPAFMGWLVTGGGVVGMASGAALLYAMGRLACRRRPWAVRTVSYGGMIVAASQACPFLQMGAGLLAVAAAGAALGTGGAPDVSARGPAGALIATIVTGLLLIACAALAGLFLRAVVLVVRRARAGVDDEWTRSGKP